MRLINDVVARFFEKPFLPVYLLNRYHYAIAFFKIVILSLKRVFALVPSACRLIEKHEDFSKPLLLP